MPVYEFECLNCHEITEAMQKFSDKPLETCEACGGKLQKIISRSAFVLKGEGWFNSGYQKPSPQATSSPKESKTTCETPGCKTPSTPCKKD